ncbi:MAG: hypothetical protein NC915_02755 [Candidatus Omnitrophica bacterium]|nr:hypothetical protein [Candidatus Omnitrophota bacterium]
MKNCIVILNDYQKFTNLVEELKKENNINEFDIKIYDLEQTDLKKFLNEIDYQPIFSEKALFIIKNVELLTKEECEKLHRVFKNIPENILVILYGLSIKAPFKESSIKENYLTPENIFFRKIYSLKMKDNQKILDILKEYMKVREKNFTLLISGIEIYLRNILINEKNFSEWIIKKFENLCNLDYFLKTGQVELGSELELHLLYYFFSEFN